MVHKVDDRRIIGPKVAGLHRGDELLDPKELVMRAIGYLDSEEHKIGEGLKIQIDRRRLQEMYSAFPDTPKDETLFTPVKGKTLVVWGAGTVGRASATNAVQMGMNVVFIDIKDTSLDFAKREFPGQIYINSSEQGAAEKIDDILSSPDVAGVVLGALAGPGARAPLLLLRDRLARINERRRAVGASPLFITDAQIDQGGGVEGVKPTSHNRPFIEIAGSVVYSVANVPGSIYTAHYASQKLQDATIEDTKRLLLAISRGTKVFEEDPLIKSALNTFGSMVTNAEVASHFGREYVEVDEALRRFKFKPKKGKIIVGVVSEVKEYENRVGLLDSGVRILLDFARQNGIEVEVWVEGGAGLGSRVTDEMYQQAGAVIKSRQEILREADLLKGVKEPMGDQLELIKEGAWMQTYFHYTGIPDDKMLCWAESNKITSFTYETRLDEQGRLPQLLCMSDVDGRSNMIILAALNNPEVIRISSR